MINSDSDLDFFKLVERVTQHLPKHEAARAPLPDVEPLEGKVPWAEMLMQRRSSDICDWYRYGEMIVWCNITKHFRYLKLHGGTDLYKLYVRLMQGNTHP